MYILLAGAMKPLNVLSIFENHFAIKTVCFQVQLEADGYFSTQKFSSLQPQQAGQAGTTSQVLNLIFLQIQLQNTCWASPKPDIPHKIALAIVDGHTRYQILRKYPFIPFEVIEKEFSSRYEALVWICKNQLGRRNLTPEQKKFLIGKQAEAEKQIKSFHGNQYTLASESGLVQNEPDRTKHGSRLKVAAEHGTSESYVYRAEQFARGVEVAEEAVSGAQEEILNGNIRATDREISSIAKVPKEKRPEVVAELRKPKVGWNRTDSPRLAPFSRCCGGRVHLRSYENLPAGSHQAGIPAGM